MTIIKVMHDCEKPSAVDNKLVAGDFFRCDECRALWVLDRYGWYRASLFEKFRYRHQGYPEAENE